jgi:GTP-binding protein
MRQAIVDETAGVTRDRHYGKCEWCGVEFSVVDTGGYTSNSDDIFEEEIRKQVVLAIEEANVVLFMVAICYAIWREKIDINGLLKAVIGKFRR